MPNIQTRPVHCADCDSEREFLERLGLTVVGCDHSGAPGQCAISFYDQRLEESSDAVATTEPPHAAAVTSVKSKLIDAEAVGLASHGNHELTSTQERTCKAVINIFETSSVVGRYGSVTVLAGDTGQLTFGRSQTTLGSGNLARLIAQYVENPAARFGTRLSEFLPKMQAKDVALNQHEHLKNILRASADDPVMRDLQDRFFDKTYWTPAAQACVGIGIRSALGRAIVYDSFVHGSWELIRNKVDAAIGSPAKATEEVWLHTYVQLRSDWLGRNNNLLLRRTVYRMEAFSRLMQLNNWGLTLPLVIQGQEVSLQSMAATPPDAFEGPHPGTRPLLLQSPMLTGLDVRLVQLELSRRGIDVRADAIFGSGARTAVMDFQKSENLPITGTLDPATVMQLATA